MMRWSMTTSSSRAVNNIERIAAEIRAVLAEADDLPENDQTEYAATVLRLYRSELQHSKERTRINIEYRDEIENLVSRLELIEGDQ